MDPAAKKKVLRLISYGLYVATSRHGEVYGSGTINWLSQSSFDPPLVMAGIQRDSSLHQAITGSRAFAIHIVGKSQKNLATAFFKTARVEGDLINGWRFAHGVTGSPILADAVAYFECRVIDEVRGGDHTIFVGEVVEADVRREEEPLTIRETGMAYGG
jgi:flavin reductase (DIM6/NTAB) family NADH-FMN oxidoreductase RutF